MTRSQELHGLILQYINLDAEESRRRGALVLQGFDHSELNCLQCIGSMDAPNVTSIAAEMNMTRGAISKIVRKLADKGAVTSYQLPDNRQKIFFRLTESGRRLFDAHAARHAAWERSQLAYFDTLPPDTLEAVIRFFQGYNDHLRTNNGI